MKKIKRINNRVKKIFSYSFLGISFFFLTFAIVPVNAYNCDAGDTACEEAKALMEAKKDEANMFFQKATSVSAVIEQLNTEISNLEASIAANEARVKELNIEIKETEKKLEETKEALAEMLVNIHFSDDSEPIRVLAGSRSISDYAEKAARGEVAKQEIAAMSEKVKNIKINLDNQKAEVEETLRRNENEKVAVIAKKENQKSLRESYEKSADEASALASYWENEVKRMTWKPVVSGGVRSSDARNTYPYGGNCWSGYSYTGDNIFYPFGGLVCQCTDYVSWKAYEKFGIRNDWYGDAWQYIYAGGRYVPNNGKTTYVDSNPAPNTIAIWPQTCYASGWCDYGHVQWVESVNPDGTINITEYNASRAYLGCYEKDFCAVDGHSSAGASFLHFE